MSAFRILLAIFIIAIISFTSVVISNHGWNLLPVFFGDIVAMTWPGQFNFDFFVFSYSFRIMARLASPFLSRWACIGCAWAFWRDDVSCPIPSYRKF